MYAEEEVAPAGSACGIVLLLHARAGFSRLVWLSHPSCCESDSLLLKVLEFFRCDVPVFLTLARKILCSIWHIVLSIRKLHLINDNDPYKFVDSVDSFDWANGYF